MRYLRSAPSAALVLLALLATACSSGAASPSSAVSATASAPASTGPASASAAASVPPPAASASAAASGVTVDSPEAAAQLVISQDPLFSAFGPQDPNLIGQCCWYEATESGDGYEVLIHAGWGDCPSGCINKHEWTFAVSRDGAVELTGETGDPIPAGGVPAG